MMNTYGYAVQTSVAKARNHLSAGIVPASPKGMPDPAARNAATFNSSGTRGAAEVRDRSDGTVPPLVMGGCGHEDYEESAPGMPEWVGGVLVAVGLLLVLAAVVFSVRSR